MKIGDYEWDSDTRDWDVRLDEESYFTCKKHIEAELLSQIIKLSQRVDKLERQRKIKTN